MLQHPLPCPNTPPPHCNTHTSVVVLLSVTDMPVVFSSIFKLEFCFVTRKQKKRLSIEFSNPLITLLWSIYYQILRNS